LTQKIGLLGAAGADVRISPNTNPFWNLDRNVTTPRREASYAASLLIFLALVFIYRLLLRLIAKIEVREA
jgi:hypothetical protein